MGAIIRHRCGQGGQRGDLAPGARTGSKPAPTPRTFSTVRAFALAGLLREPRRPLGIAGLDQVCPSDFAKCPHRVQNCHGPSSSDRTGPSSDASVPRETPWAPDILCYRCDGNRSGSCFSCLPAAAARRCWPRGMLEVTRASLRQPSSGEPRRSRVGPPRQGWRKAGVGGEAVRAQAALVRVASVMRAVQRLEDSVGVVVGAAQ